MAPRVVVAHDYLTQRGGAERVVLAIMRAFTDAPLLTSFYDAERTFPEFRRYDVRPMAGLNRIGPLRADPRRALPLLARAFSRTHAEADVVVASSSGWAHGVATDAPKIVYCHNPPRWLHQPADYLADQPLPVRLALRALRPSLLRWDTAAASAASVYLANSSSVRERIRTAYGIDADVLFPPTLIDPEAEQEAMAGLDPGFVLTVSRARGYKNAAAICAAVEAIPGARLVVVGGLPPHPSGGSWSGRLLGASDISDEQLRWLYANASVLVAVGREDFGLTPLEANAFGTPVVALRAGGYLDTVVPGVTGEFVDEATPAAIAAAIEQARSTSYDAGAIRAHASKFSPEAFADRLRGYVDRYAPGA